MYELIGSVCGKHGFEATRTGGLSGVTTDQTDVEFLHAMHKINSALLRRLGGCKITRNKLHYHVTYWRKEQKLHLTPCTTGKCCPVKRGGLFDMAPGMLMRYPWLGEFLYLKMTAVMIMNFFNVHHKANCKAPIATGPIEQDMETVMYAGRVFHKCGSYFNLITNYNLRNKYSMVCHAVGFYFDIFNCGTKSIENKMFLVLNNQCGKASRGGSLFGNKCCFVLLD